MLNSKIIKIFIIIAFCISVCNCVSCANTDPDLSQSTDALKAEICKKPKDSIKFPLKIKHEYGTTVIRKKPQRIATYGFYDHEEDTVLALNIAPIAISDVRRQEEIPKWQIEKLHELNAPMPAIVNMKMKWYPEAIQSHKPDVIFVDSSELESYDNYKKLSKIAPVIPFTDYVVKGSEIKGNQRIMECKVRLYARALGVSKRGELLIRKIRSTIKNALNTHPSLKRKHVIVTDVYLNSKGSISIGSLNLDNPRTGFLYDIGLPILRSLNIRVAVLLFPGQNCLLIFLTSMSLSPTTLRTWMRKQSQPCKLTKTLGKFQQLKTEESSSLIKTTKIMVLSVTLIRFRFFGGSIHTST